MKTSTRQSRRGVALFIVMLVMAIISVFMVTINMQILLNRRAVERRQHQLQAAWLARSGVEIAAARLTNDPEKYTGETLEIIPDSQLRIDVQREKNAPGVYNVNVEAKYPAETPGHAVVHALQRRLRSPGKATQVQTRAVP